MPRLYSGTMALKATISKAELEISDMDRQYYASHSLTLARHPSETDERMMVRLLAFAFHAHERLTFGERMSERDEPDLFLNDLTGAIELWIDVGQPDEARLRKACGRAKQVFVYAYSGHGAGKWWEQSAAELARFKNLTVVNVPGASSQAIAKLATPRMTLQCVIQDGAAMLIDGATTVQIVPEFLKRP
jgi:uncharacterized protein YaeQ